MTILRQTVGYCRHKIDWYLYFDHRISLPENCKRIKIHSPQCPDSSFDVAIGDTEKQTLGYAKQHLRHLVNLPCTFQVLKNM